MLFIFLSLVVGVVVGIFIRGTWRGYITHITQLLGYVLLFAMGISLGADTAIWEHVGTIGWSSIVTALWGVAGSIAVASLYDRFHTKEEV